MTTDLLFGLMAYAFATSITPGPNNIMLMASGANFGLRRTVPHMLGVSLGHALMVLLVALGIGAAFRAAPWAESAFAAVAAAYMLWLAWRIATAAAPDGARAGARPFTFLQAAAFQWVNPKAWAMALTAAAAYAPSGSLVAAASVAVVFAAVNLPSVSVWAALGTQVRRVLTAPARLKAFNWTMAALVVGSAYVVLR